MALPEKPQNFCTFVEPPHSAIGSRDSTGFSFVASCGTLCKPALLRVLLLRMLFRFLHRILHLRLLCVRQNREKIAARNGPLDRNRSQFQLLHLLGDRSKEARVLEPKDWGDMCCANVHLWSMLSSSQCAQILYGFLYRTQRILPCA